MELIQASQRRPVAFVPEQHTDFIFSITPPWIGVVLVIVVSTVILIWYYRRRRKDMDDQGPLNGHGDR